MLEFSDSVFVKINKVVSHRCVYIDCLNNRAKTNDITFFKFPTKDVTRTKEWQTNCGNIDVAVMEPEELKMKLICENHFLYTDIRINNKRKLLTNTAVPIKYELADTTDPFLSERKLVTYSPKRTISNNQLAEEEIKIEELTTNFPTASTFINTVDPLSTELRLTDDMYNVKIEIINSQSDEEVKIEEATINLPTVSSSISTTSNISTETRLSDSFQQMPSTNPANLKLKYEKMYHAYNNLKKKYKCLYSQKYRLKKSIASSSLDNLLKRKNETVKTFVYMQCFHTKRTPWTVYEKHMAMSLYCKSTSCYKFMRNNLKFALPSVRIMQSWLKAANMSPGVKNNFIKKQTSVKCKKHDKSKKAS